MHFIFELIQNADDAKYDNYPRLKFVVTEEYLELSYNERGFETEDVLSITGTGHSTKIKGRDDSNKFIGEKGIGFKSVFALASSVEIISPPWHFMLEKDQCIVPVPLPCTTTEKGTTLRLRYSRSEDIDKVANELERYFTEQPEIFLFLLKLSSFEYEDRRSAVGKKYKIRIEPENREGDRLTIRMEPSGNIKEYLLCAEEHCFSKELAIERWGDTGAKMGDVVRKFTAAAIMSGDRQGKLFCFLPTGVGIPLPFHLQVDGHTKADREKLHDITSNSWNRHLIGILPEFTKRAILKWKEYPAIADRLPDYIPLNEEYGQLSGMFFSLRQELRHTAWVMTWDNDWEIPENTVIPNEITEYLIKWVPNYRLRAEKYLGKKFVSPKWKSDQRWVEKLKAYGVSQLSTIETTALIRFVPIGESFLANDNQLIYLYRYMDELNELRFGKNTREKEEIINNLRLSEIFPVAGESLSSLGPRDSARKIYMIRTDSMRDTGFASDNTVDFRVVNQEYTYSPDMGSKLSDETRFKNTLINTRNELVRAVLGKLGVSEYNSDNLLRELQIPTLVSDNTNMERKIQILMAIFKAYQDKRSMDDDYLAEVLKISNARFLSSDGTAMKLCELGLPDELLLEEDDKEEVLLYDRE